jgi:hypothetical protein
MMTLPWAEGRASVLAKAKSAFRDRFPFLAAARQLQLNMKDGNVPLFLEYAIHPRPRYGWGKAAHPELQRVIESGRARYASILEQLAPFTNRLRKIPIDAPDDPASPFWENRFVMGLDPVSLYAFPSLFHSKRYLEIGSGNSTKFVRRSVNDHRLDLKIVSVDPAPRAEIDALCDEVIRSPLETLDLAVIDQLESGDILMVDNSHRCFQNSDVEVTFLEILPRLKPGVLVYIDDIYLPCDYPPQWAERYYSEQYLLGVLLLADAGRRYELLFPGFFVCTDPALREAAERFWKGLGIGACMPDSNGFWMRVKAG